MALANVGDLFASWRLTPGFEHVPPVWELRVGDIRVFYDFDQSAGRVFVRAVRLKKPPQQTKDIT
jgi:hypothetical protein